MLLIIQFLTADPGWGIPSLMHRKQASLSMSNVKWSGLSMQGEMPPKAGLCVAAGHALNHTILRLASNTTDRSMG